MSWYIAAIIAGLPVWIIPWRKISHAVTSPDPAGMNERRSVIRKIYLYFFLFLATMTILGSAVYIVFRIVNTVLGANPPTLTELGYAISLSVIATVVLLYHGNALRGDSKYAKLEQANLLKDARVVLVNVDNSSIGPAVIEEVKREIPELSLDSISLTSETEKSAATDESQEAIIKQLAQANVIVAPWMIAVAGSGAGMVSAKIAQAVVSSAARKLLIPLPMEGWEWAGMESWDAGAIARHTARAVKQVLAGEQVKLHRPMSAGAIIGIILGVLFLLIIIASGLITLAQYLFY